MATLPGDRLTAAHRAAQVRNAALLAAKLRRRYAAVDLSNPASGRAFLDLAVADVVEHHGKSSEQAVAYLRALQPLEAPGEVVVVDRGPAPNLEQIRRSLAAVGLGAGRLREDRVRQEGEGGESRREADLGAARSKTTAAVMGAGVRLTVNGSRDTVKQYAGSDRRVRAYVRVTAGDDRVCFFCAMLASRVDFTADSFEVSDSFFVGDGDAKVHDTCRCNLRPIYTKELPDETLEYQRLWRDLSGEAINGDDRGALKNFRSQWEKRQRGTGVEAEPSRVA